MKKIIYLIMLVVFAISVSALNQERLAKGHEFICKYNVIDNKWGINDIELLATFQRDEFYECPSRITAPLLVEKGEQTFDQGEIAEGYNYQCIYSAQDDVSYSVMMPDVSLTFNSRDFYDCPRIALYFQHAGEFQVKSVPQVWAEIQPGDTERYNVEKNSIPVTDITFTVSGEAESDFEDVQMSAYSLEYIPSVAGSFPEDEVIYDYMRIELEGVMNENVVASEINFNVMKDWLQNNDIDMDNIQLYRYSNGNWKALPTYIDRETATRVYYTADTPGFSYFAVAGQTEEQNPGDDIVVTPGNGQDSAPQPPVMEDNQTPWWQISLTVLGVLLLVALIVTVMLTSRRR